MEIKLTERDKLLLIVLVILVIIFAGVMIPKYGIMASINTITDAKKQIEDQKVINTEALDALVGIGVPASVADRPGAAVSRINQEICDSRYDAVKESLLSLSADSTSVAREWLIPIGYVDFENGTDADKILSDVDVKNNTNGYTAQSFMMDSNEYDVSVYACELSCISEVTDFSFSSEYSGADLTDVCQMIMAYNLFSERGSIDIQYGQGNWVINDDGSMKWMLRLVIPQDSKIDYYKSILGECHNCGQYYSLEGFNPQVPNYCDCGELRTGESLK